MKADLRDALQMITDNEQPEQHAAHIFSLKMYRPHSIQIVKEFNTQERNDFNCYMFALGIENEEWARDLFVRFGFPSSTGVAEAMRQRGIKFETCGQVLVYKNDTGTPKHMGRAQENELIVSKWGTGNLWRHGPWEIPRSYGNTIQYLSMDFVEVVVDYFHNLHCALSRRSEH